MQFRFATLAVAISLSLAAFAAPIPVDSTEPTAPTTAPGVAASPTVNTPATPAAPTTPAVPATTPAATVGTPAAPEATDVPEAPTSTPSVPSGDAAEVQAVLDEVTEKTGPLFETLNTQLSAKSVDPEAVAKTLGEIAAVISDAKAELSEASPLVGALDDGVKTSIESVVKTVNGVVDGLSKELLGNPAVASALGTLDGCLGGLLSTLDRVVNGVLAAVLGLVGSLLNPVLGGLDLPISL